MSEAKPICNNCRWCMTISVPDTPAVIMQCELHYTTDPVTGFRHFNPCSDYNSHGECQQWEQGGFLGLIQRLHDKVYGNNDK